MTMYSPDPHQRYPGTPATVTPLREFLDSGPRPGISPGYAVLPRSLAEAMPLPWQQQMAYLLYEFHQVYAHLEWPEYRVVPSRKERLVDLDEDQLAEVGCIVEIDTDGELVYRERNGRRIDNPESYEVLVSCLDPIPIQQANANQDTPPRGLPLRQTPHWG